MKNYKYPSIILAIIFAILATVSIDNKEAFALTCASETLQQQIDRASVIFAGKVTNVQTATSDKSANASFEVIEYWKGQVGKKITVGGIYPWTGMPSSMRMDKDIYFKVGETYLVFAQNGFSVPEDTKGIPNNLIAGISCGRTRLLTAASEEKATLGKGKIPTEVGPYNFTRNLSVGYSGEDVVALQTFLEQKGFLTMPPAIAKGYFGGLTRVAVIKFQASIGLPNTGYVGPLTRGKLNADNSALAFNIISPNGGERWQKGTAQKIVWVRSSGAVDIRLVQPPCTEACPAHAAYGIPTIASGVNADQGSYDWIVGNILPYNTPNSTLGSVPVGPYIVQICQTATNVCGSSQSSFTIYSNDSTQPIVMVTSPNGGERWDIKSVHPITWNYKNINSESKVDLYLTTAYDCPVYDPKVIREIICVPNSLITLDKNIYANTIYNWIVGTDIVDKPISKGNYVLRVCVAGTSQCDDSDKLFTIADSKGENIVKTVGEKESSFLIQIINSDSVEGVWYDAYPIPTLEGTPKTLRIGDDIGYTCDGISEKLTSIDHYAQKITFTKVVSQSPPGGCPVCLSDKTLIDTPSGKISVKDLQVGMSVWTIDQNGNRIAVPITQTSKIPVPLTHKMVDLILNDGREVFVSPGHPTVDGQTVGNLSIGHTYDGSSVLSAKLIQYGGGATYDILPSGDTGFYWADGVLLGSTLSHRFSADLDKK